MRDRELLQSWIKLLQEINGKLDTIEEEKKLANYPITQNTEDWMHIVKFSLNGFVNAIEEDLENLN